MISYKNDITLFSVAASRFAVTGIDNDVLACEALESQQRLSYDPTIPLFEDTVFSPKDGSEGRRLLDAVESLAAENGLRVVEIWSQIHRTLESTGLHNHKGGDITDAFVYYAAVPQGAGLLTFQFENGATYSVAPQAGDLYLFPAWVMHKVSKNLSQDVRISIAGNLAPT